MVAFKRIVVLLLTVIYACDALTVRQLQYLFQQAQENNRQLKVANQQRKEQSRDTTDSKNSQVQRRFITTLIPLGGGETPFFFFSKQNPKLTGFTLREKAIRDSQKEFEKTMAKSKLVEGSKKQSSESMETKEARQLIGQRINLRRKSSIEQLLAMEQLLGSPNLRIIEVLGENNQPIGKQFLVGKNTIQMLPNNADNVIVMDNKGVPLSKEPDLKSRGSDGSRDFPPDKAVAEKIVYNILSNPEKDFGLINIDDLEDERPQGSFELPGHLSGGGAPLLTAENLGASSENFGEQTQFQPITSGQASGGQEDLRWDQSKFPGQVDPPLPSGGTGAEQRQSSHLTQQNFFAQPSPQRAAEPVPRSVQHFGSFQRQGQSYSGQYDSPDEQSSHSSNIAQNYPPNSGQSYPAPPAEQYTAASHLGFSSYQSQNGEAQPVESQYSGPGANPSQSSLNYPSSPVRQEENLPQPGLSYVSPPVSNQPADPQYSRPGANIHNPQPPEPRFYGPETNSPQPASTYLAPPIQRPPVGPGPIISGYGNLIENVSPGQSPEYGHQPPPSPSPQKLPISYPVAAPEPVPSGYDTEPVNFSPVQLPETGPPRPPVQFPGPKYGPFSGEFRAKELQKTAAATAEMPEERSWASVKVSGKPEFSVMPQTSPKFIQLLIPISHSADSIETSDKFDVQLQQLASHLYFNRFFNSKA